jgi:hypothetical protein
MVMNFNKLNKLQAEASKKFKATNLGKLLVQTAKDVKNGTATVKSVMTGGAKLKQLAGSAAAKDLMKEMGLGPAWDMIEKYAGKNVWKKITSKLGSVGKLLSNLGNSKVTGAPVGVERELEVAANLLKAFGYGVTKPGGGTSVAPQHAPEYKKAIEQIAEASSQKQGKGMVSGAKLKPLPGWSGTYVQSASSGHFETQLPMQEGMLDVDSSNVHSIGFQYETAEKGTLLVRYLGSDSQGNRVGPGSLYEYFNVPSAIWVQFKNAASKGKFVWDHLRIRGTVSGHKFTYDLAGVVGNYVPRRAQLVFVQGPKGPQVREMFVQRSFKVGEIKKGKLTMRNIRSALPTATVGSKIFKQVKGKG